MTLIHWTAALDSGDGFGHPFTANRTTDLPPWAFTEGDGASAAATVLERFFEPAQWDEMFGADEDSGEALIRIHAPAQYAGDYRVDLDRVIRGRAARITG